jgi:hypothetical protein
MSEKHSGKLTCLWAVCDPRMSINPLAWFELHQEGITRELMKDLVDKGEWQGPPPVFENAPAYDSEMWLHMVAAAEREK